MNLEKNKKLLTTVGLLICGLGITICAGIIVNKYTKFIDTNYGINSVISGLIIFVIVSIALYVFRHSQIDVDDSAKISKKDTEFYTKQFYDSLKKRYKKRYDSKLDGRFEITLEVSENWEGKNTKEFKGEHEGKGQISEAFEYINTAFDKHRRLLIVGNPGVGKTVLLLKLALELLEKANVENDDGTYALNMEKAFPVIFNLASWSEDYKKFDDWLVSVLRSNEGVSQDLATELLQNERIIFLLDGLDELARNEEEKVSAKKRAECLNSLNNYLDRNKKAVICCRVDEFKQLQSLTGKDAPVSTKVKVNELSEAEILNSLLKAQQNKSETVAATHILKMLENDENRVFLEVLSNPFYFTITLDIFDKQIIEERDFQKEQNELQNYLQKLFIEKKLNITSNSNDFNKEKTLKWLKWLAGLMKKKQNITFEFADLKPYEFVSLSFLIFVAFIFYFTFVFLLNRLMIYHTYTAIVLGGVGGLAGVILVFILGTEENIRWRFNKFLRLKTAYNLLINIVLFSFFFGAILYFTVHGWFFGLILGGCMGGWVGIEESCRENVPFSQIEKPYERVLASITYVALEFAIAFGLIFVVASILFFKSNPFLDYAFMFFQFLTGFILGAFIRLFIHSLFIHLIIRFCLSIEGKIPLKYATFLDYCADARILEKDGGHWRFRHQNLQDYFAELDLDK